MNDGLQSFKIQAEELPQNTKTPQLHSGIGGSPIKVSFAPESFQN